jgi:serine-type anaerobic sulfatase-maturating enzyme
MSLPRARTPLRHLPAQLAQFSFLFAAPDEILTDSEREIFLRLRDEPADLSVPCALSGQIVLIMKATRLCNLRCTYCNAWKEGPDQVMPFEVLARATRDVLRRPAVKHVTFVWHGGEVTLLPVGFFKKALWLQQAFSNEHQTLSNAIQTNGTRLSEEWISLLSDGKFQVGVSLDGPRQVHDSKRKTKSGRPTWDNVKAGIARLKAADLSFGVLVVVDKQVLELGPKVLLDCLVEDLGVRGAALLNVIPGNAGSVPSNGDYLPWADYVAFLRELFRCWWPEYRNKINIRELSSLVQVLSGGAPGTCVLAGECMGRYLTVEANGTVSACDKYIGDDGLDFGNLLHSDLNTLLARSGNLARAREQAQCEKAKMAGCKYFAYCRGGCPHDRRLNQFYDRRWPGTCCGLADLLDEVHATIKNGAST